MYETSYAAVAELDPFRALLQLQNGRVNLSSNGNVAYMAAGPAAGGTMAKSAFSISVPSTGSDGVIVTEFDFKIPEGQPVNSVFIADFESANANIGQNPGVRIQLDDGMIRVERGKIGYDDPWYGTEDAQVLQGEWNALRVELTPGDEDSGAIKVYLNGNLIIEETGATMITQDVLAGTGITLEGGEIDRVQVGLTANANSTDAAVAVRNVSVGAADPAGKMLTYAFDPRDAADFASAIYAAGTENHLLVVDDDPDAGFFGITLKGDTGRDKLTGTKFDDLLLGRKGSDQLIGGAGDDVLKGGRYRDRLDGGAGDDLLKGGGGKDTFVFTFGEGQDTVLDFKPGTDKLLIASGGSGYDDLDFQAVAGEDPGVLIHDRDSSIFLAGVSLMDLTQDDLILA